ncbi:hypothetical protein CK203_026113 [Vitis vinifera]|uniref:Uncharacterized protein n=1 Tax=Vitis vinifera TaxID=29760 RepID=A0A438IJ91_VITVI|nr:hypothetical protein CK203_026113 [Vitis vinifera]
MGCLVEGEKRSEAWVRIVGLPIFLWDSTVLRRVGEECGGFLAVDSQTENLEELQWARLLLWKINIPREEVGGEVIARAGQRMVEEEDDTRLETLQQLVEGTWGQASGSRRQCLQRAFWWTSEEENNKAIGTDSSPDPSQPPLVDNAQISVTYSSLVEEQQTVEKSKTDHALIEEALSPRGNSIVYDRLYQELLREQP